MGINIDERIIVAKAKIRAYKTALNDLKNNLADEEEHLQILEGGRAWER